MIMMISSKEEELKKLLREESLNAIDVIRLILATQHYILTINSSIHQERNLICQARQEEAEEDHERM